MMSRPLTPAMGKVFKNKNSKTGKTFLVVRLVPEELARQMGSLDNAGDFSIIINQVDSNFGNNFVGYATLVKNDPKYAANTANMVAGETSSSAANTGGAASSQGRFASLLDDL